MNGIIQNVIICKLLWITVLSPCYQLLSTMHQLTVSLQIVFLFFCSMTMTRASIVVNGTGKAVKLAVETLHFTKFDSTTFDNSLQWTYVNTPTTVSMLRCANSCIETPSCSGFFYNDMGGASPNCFINDKLLRSDHRMSKNNIHYFEITVSTT